ncbi:MAG: FtsX-like permease family protein, partial [Rhodothermia bacterium]
SATGPTLVEELPEVLRFARFHPNDREATLSFTDSDGERRIFRETRLAYVDPDFLELFSFPLIRGKKQSVLSEPRSMIISESVARRYFGDDNPVGRVINLRAWSRGDYVITGVFEDVPGNSHLQFEYLLPLNDLLDDKVGQYGQSDGWTWRNFITYAQLHPAADVESVGAKATEVITAHNRQRLEESQRSFQLTFQPLEEIHLHSDFDPEFSSWSNGSRQTVYFFTVVALFILALAWVNYINLSTARAIERSKEVGVRKAVGALRSQVVMQFVFESAIVNLIALFLAVGLSVLGLPFLNQLAGTSIDLSVWSNPWLYVSFVVVFGLGSLLAGLYPAFVLSAYEPATVLKGGSVTGTGQHRLREALVVFQFATSVALLIGTYVVYSQVQYIRGFDIGLDLDHILVIKRPSVIEEGSSRRVLREIFKSSLERQATIQSVTTSNTVPGGDFPWGTSVKREGAPESEGEEVYVTWINYGFVETYDLKLIAGRNFSKDFPSDRGRSVVINETAVQALGIDSAEKAIGQRIELGNVEKRVRIVIGVLEDFNWMSAKKEIPAIAFDLTPAGWYYSLKIEMTNLAETLDQVRSIYDSIFPGNPFDYFFADRFFDEQHRADKQFSTLLGLFSLFALLVACLGLVGLSAYSASRRTKEIGVRKALGARSIEIMVLMMADTVKLVAVAVVLASPFVYFALDRWLDNFPVHVDLTVWVFIVPGIAVLLIAFLTVSYHTARVAAKNPVESLRYE